MKFFPKLLICTLVYLSTFLTASAEDVFEIPRSLIVPIKDTGTGRFYELFIKMPNNYSKDKVYPVVYMTDGMYVFQTVSGATRFPINFGRMENAMLVGISWEKKFPAGLSRQRDYTPTTDRTWKDPTGQAKQHLDFIRNDVIKYVEATYSVDPNHRTYVGNSLGGLFGAYVLFTKPDTFKNYILGSPSFWFDNEVIFSLEKDFFETSQKLNANVYIAVGEYETPEFSDIRHNMVEQATRFHTQINSRGYLGMKTKFDIIPSANHSIAFPTSAIHGLWWLLSKRPTSKP